MRQVKVRVQDGFIADGSLRHNLAIVVRHKGLPPEFAFPFRPHPVDGADIAAVGCGMAALYGFPHAQCCCSPSRGFSSGSQPMAVG